MSLKFYSLNLIKNNLRRVIINIIKNKINEMNGTGKLKLIFNS